jgi:hypothetical protein
MGTPHLPCAQEHKALRRQPVQCSAMTMHKPRRRDAARVARIEDLLTEMRVEQQMQRRKITELQQQVYAAIDRYDATEAQSLPFAAVSRRVH